MPLNLTREQMIQLQDLRRQWYEIVQPIDGFVPSQFIEPVPEFLVEHLDGARILPKRADVMSFLPTGAKIAEVGTQQGLFAKKIYDVLRPEELHLFDVDFSPFHSKCLLPEGTQGLVLHQGDSSTLLSGFPDAYFDIIYIDGDHSYEGVKRDADIAVRKIKPNGVLWFNDFTPWSPVEMIDYGVPYVVSELCHSGEWKIEFLALHPLFYSDVVLTKSDTNKGRDHG